MKKSRNAVANRPMHQAMVGLRQSSAASPHTPKPRKGTRTNRDRNAITESQKG